MCWLNNFRKALLILAFTGLVLSFANAETISLQDFENPGILEKMSNIQGNPLPLPLKLVSVNSRVSSFNRAGEFRNLRQDQTILVPVQNFTGSRQQYFHFALLEKESLYLLKTGLRLTVGSQVLWFAPNQMIYQPHPRYPDWIDVYIPFESVGSAESINSDALVLQAKNHVTKLTLDDFSILDEIDFIQSFAPQEVLALQDFEPFLFSENSDLLWLQGKKSATLLLGRRGRGRTLGIQTSGKSPVVFYVPLARTFRKKELDGRFLQFWFKAGQDSSEFKIRVLESRESENFRKPQRQNMDMTWFKIEGQNWKKINMPLTPEADLSGILIELPAGQSQTFWIDDVVAIKS